MRGLAKDRNIIIKPAVKGFCVVLWDRENYLTEAEKQLQDADIYEDSDFQESDLVKLVEKSNTMFQSLRRKNLITEKELKYFSYQYKKSTNFGKMYLFPKIHKKLGNVSGCPVISNCGAPTEKASEFLHHHLQPILKSGVSYILKNLGKIPENAFLVAADVVELYSSTPHDEGLEVLRNQLNAFDNKSIPNEDLLKMAEFISKTIILNLIQLLNIKFRERLLELNLLHCMHVSLRITLKKNFSKAIEFSPGFGLAILMIFFSSGELVKKSLASHLNSFQPNLKFTHERSRESLNFLNVIVKIQQSQICYRPIL